MSKEPKDQQVADSSKDSACSEPCLHSAQDWEIHPRMGTYCTECKRYVLGPRTSDAQDELPRARIALRKAFDATERAEMLQHMARAEAYLRREPVSETAQKTFDLWVQAEDQCGFVSPDREHVCTMTDGHPGSVHVEIDPVFGLPRGAWIDARSVRPTATAEDPVAAERERCARHCEVLAHFMETGAGPLNAPGARLRQAAQSIRYGGETCLWRPEYKHDPNYEIPTPTCGHGAQAWVIACEECGAGRESDATTPRRS